MNYDSAVISLEIANVDKIWNCSFVTHDHVLRDI